MNRQRATLTNNFVPGGQLKTQMGTTTNNVPIMPKPQGNVTRPTQNQMQKPPTNVAFQQMQSKENQQIKEQQQPKIVHHTLNQQLSSNPPVAIVQQSNNIHITPIPQEPLQGILKKNNEPILQEPLPMEIKLSLSGIMQEDELICPMDIGENVEPKKKLPFLKTRQKGKVSKHDRIKKRNKRLRNILQPKNASMVLNELVGNVTTNVEENVGFASIDNIFRATIMYDSIEHEGFGKSKAQAKSYAAEAVVRHIFLKRIKENLNNKPPTAQQQQEQSIADGIDENKDVKMEDVEEEEDEEILFSWSHIASFALYKFLSSFNEGATIMNIIKGDNDKVQSVSATKADTKLEVKLAKKLPDNSVEMNPIMLIYQMRPNTSFEEMSVTGTHPNILFSVKCTVDNEEFIGYGLKKKTARKNAAYKACQSVLKVEYPPEIITELSMHSGN